MSNAKISLDIGNEYPFDASDAWWNDSDKTMPDNMDSWVFRAARGIVADLKDRRGIKNEFENIDEDVRVDIIRSIAEIILLAREGETVTHV